MAIVRLPVTDPAMCHGWQKITELYEKMPTGWTIVGGQMVVLHCAERGRFPARATHDLDAVLDVRAIPMVLHQFTGHLRDLGFRPTGTSAQGHQHRWVVGEAQIDIMIPRRVGERAATRTGVTGATTLETPGAQQALDRSQVVEVTVDDVRGHVNRPNLLGALVAKAAASRVQLDRNRDRHLIDFATLAALSAAADGIHLAGGKDLFRLRLALTMLEARPDLVASVAGAHAGVTRVRAYLDNAAVSRREGSRSDAPW